MYLRQVQLRVRQSQEIYGRLSSWEEAKLVLIAVPWEGGVSFRRGTAKAPSLIRLVSRQIDYYRSEYPHLEAAGLFWAEPEKPFGGEGSPDLVYETQVLPYVEQWVEAALLAGKPFGIVGGDHSVPLGAHRKLQTYTTGYGVLHIDAHADLRPQYEGLVYSHATILHHVLELPKVERAVAVGIRDWAQSEAERAHQLSPRLIVYEMRRLSQATLLGRPWSETVREIISLLPEKVYLSLDADALEVGYVPNTGTPVPGGLRYEELFFLLESLRNSGRQLIGFDLCETGGQELDAIVSAHLLYRLCGLVLEAVG